MIKRLMIKNFGSIKDKNLLFENNLNIIYGENEIGKSTIHEAIRSLVFGFSPSKLENHIYKPWDGSSIFLEGEIKGEKLLSITRKLTNRADGNVSENSNVKNIGNNTIDDMKQIPRDIFRQVYAITLDDMVSLSNRSMELVFDGLVESYGLDFLNSPNDAVKSIEIKENEIYKKNRRGKYRVKEIDDELKVLNSQIRESEKNVDEYFRSKLEFEKIECLKKEKELKISEINILSDIILSCIDVFRLKNLVDQIRSEINFYGFKFENLLNHININIDLNNELLNVEGKSTDLKKDLDVLMGKSEELNDEDKYLLQKRPDYVIIKSQINTLHLNNREIENKINILIDKKAENGLLETQVFTKKLNKDELESIINLDVISVKKYIDDKSNINKTIPYKLKFSELIATSIIFVLILICWYFKYFSLVYIGTIIISILMTKIYFDYRNRDLKKEKIGEDNNLISLLNTLPIPIYYIKNIDQEYLNKIYLFRNKQIEINILENDLQNLNDIQNSLWKTIIFRAEDERLVNEKKEIEKLEEILVEFYHKIENIKFKELSQSSISERVLELNMKLDENYKDIEKLRFDLDENYKFASLNYKLNPIEFEELTKDPTRVKLGAQSEASLFEIEKLNELTEEIEKLQTKGVEFSHKYLSELKKKSDAIIDEIKILEYSSGELKEKIKSLYIEDKRVELISRLKQLKIEREDIMINRVVLSVAKELIISFDKEFRDENQPDILKNTSEYFSTITDGKYQKVYMNSDTNELVLKSEFGERSITSGFSRGTKEQLYFCFRLAIIKHLHDNKTYNIPIIIDDIFVNWDYKRIDRLKDLLLEISRERQIIMFTCHKSQMELFGENALVNIIEL